ncbi:uncharacterized protein EV420DRAFT_1643312 [Desarmillaria tabescens]|uniref:Uncharacterized protein n=1 Tax=Armillaria tabescens TaxID=1929756 RepID=A0AA39KB88_ARMTA|nr:uncharacterized protein EV420DRAFT_1643312 [Desarmillaria tabescens]KAK0457956.1 hypothetical protein EV420DRAFT_1643312 [Desarmillaria tabescens]
MGQIRCCDCSIRTINAIPSLVRVSDNDCLWLASTGSAIYSFQSFSSNHAFFLATSPTLASPAPLQADLVKFDTDLLARADGNILDIFSDLKGVADEILPEIESLIKNNALTQDLVMPLINDLIEAIKNATSELGGLDKSSIVVGGTNEELATLIAGIVKDISGTMDGLTTASVDLSSLDLGSILLDAGDVLAGLVLTVVGLVGGLLALLLPLLLPVVGLLVTIVVGLLGGLLGLIL